MNNPLPTAEVRGIMGGKGFVRLHGQDAFLFVSDLPRREPAGGLAAILKALRERGYMAQLSPADLLCIDLQPERWRALLNTFEDARPVTFPQNETLHGVYALARLLSRHPSAFERQPMDMIRAVFKRCGARDGLAALAPQLHAGCARRLRCAQPLPSALAKVLYAWLANQ